jgi:hypothetical protein
MLNAYFEVMVDVVLHYNGTSKRVRFCALTPSEMYFPKEPKPH